MMTDICQRYDSVDIAPEEIKEFISVQNLLKEFGGKTETDTKADNGAVVSVKNRLQKHDSREDDEEDYRKSDDNTSSSRDNSPSKEFQYGDVLLKKVEKPVEDKWKKNIGNDSSSTEVAETQRKVEDLLKKVEKPLEGRWKKNISNQSTVESEDIQHLKQESLSRSKSAQNVTVNAVVSQTKSVPKRIFRKSGPLTTNHNKPQSMSSRSTSMPIFAGSKQDQSSSVRAEKYQNDLAAALKKVGLPVEDKWKSMKKSDEEGSETSKPVFATMKLRSVGTPTSNSATSTPAASRVNEKFQHQTTSTGLKPKFNFDQDDNEMSNLPKRRRMPSYVDDLQTPTTCYGERDGGTTDHDKISPHKVATGCTSVANLAKTFASQINLAPKLESAEEEKVTSAEEEKVTSVEEEKVTEKIRSNNKSSEISPIRCTLKSTATELEDLRKALNSSTPVSKLIAERNKAAQALKPEKKFPAEKLLVKKSHRRTKSLTSNPMENCNRRTKSMSSTQTDNTTTDEQSSLRGLTAPSWKRSRENELEIVESDDFSECWKNMKAKNNVTDGGDIWNLNLNDSVFFNGHGTVSCPGGLKYQDDDVSGSHHDNTTLSECTTNSDGDFYHENFGHSRYIQITLSSGGITEKFEPTVVMSPTESSSAYDDDSSIAYEYPMGDSMDASVIHLADSKRDKLKGLVPLKGAKKFFFGKNKRKSARIEV